MKTIILVRHSEPQRTASIPNDKIPLSEAGRILAKTFFAQKIFENPQCVYSSPYLRAIETASCLSEKFVVDERLKERALGDLESLDATFWAKQYENLDFKNRNGESMNETACRMDSCIGEVFSKRNSSDIWNVSQTAIVTWAKIILRYCSSSTSSLESAR